MLTYSRSFLDLLLFQLASVLYYFISFVFQDTHSQVKQIFVDIKHFPIFQLPYSEDFPDPILGLGGCPTSTAEEKLIPSDRTSFPVIFPAGSGGPSPPAASSFRSRPLLVQVPGMVDGQDTTAPRPQYTCMPPHQHLRTVEHSTFQPLVGSSRPPPDSQT